MSKIVLKTKYGVSYSADSYKLIKSSKFLKKYKGKINLIFTSPPFDLNHQKKYGSKIEKEYIKWLVKFAKPLSELLTDDGSIVIEMGNAWKSGSPTYSTTPLEALLDFKKEANLHLCQEFICHNPSRLPSPASWVTVKRVRVKDSYTRLWWLSKNTNPKADNRKILMNYSHSMLHKMKKNKIYTGKRPSGYKITSKFLKDNGGSISPNFIGDSEIDNLAETSLSIANSNKETKYINFCRANNLQPHPARIQHGTIEYFVRFLTDEEDIVFDPFGGSNSLGMVSEKLKRNWISSELNIDYIKGSIIRFHNETEATDHIKRMAEKG